MRVRTAGYGIFQQKRSGRPFIIKVNYASGFTVTLPLITTVGYNYNFIVDWGDGSVGEVTSATDADRIHAYASGGTYTITMTGTLEGWLGNAIGLKEYITEVTQWGKTGFKSISMYNCTRLGSCYTKLTTTQTSFSEFFGDCTAMTYCDVSEWDVSNITRFSNDGGGAYGMFRNCTNLTQLDLSNWTFSTTSDVLIGGLCYGCSKLTTVGNISNWNLSRVYHIGGLFRNCVKLEPGNFTVADWDVSYIQYFGSANSGGAFVNCYLLTNAELDVATWDTSRAVSLYQLFYSCIGVTSFNVSTWDTSNVTTFESMFQGCTGLDGDGSAVLDVSNWVVSKGTSFVNMFYGCNKLDSLDLSAWNWNITADVNLQGMCMNCTLLTTVGDMSYWDMSRVYRLIDTFAFCSSLSSTYFDPSTWDVSYVANFSLGGAGSYGTFRGCTSLTTLDLSSWVFSSTKDVFFGDVFALCSNLTSIGDVSGWNTTKFTNLGGTFYGCSSLSSTYFDPSAWDVQNVTSFASAMYGGFLQGCTSLTSLNLNGWNITKCTNFSGMFGGLTGLTTLDLSSWTLNTTSGISMISMFQNCAYLTSLNLVGWDTSKVTNLSYFLSGCTRLTTCDVSGFVTTSLTNTNNTFRDCQALATINISGWDMSLVTINSQMFFNCYALTVLTLPASLTKVDNSFASGCIGLTVYNIYRATAPTVSGTPFGNYAKPLHVPVSNSGYDITPWTNTVIFSSIINDL